MQANEKLKRSTWLASVRLGGLFICTLYLVLLHRGEKQTSTKLWKKLEPFIRTIPFNRRPKSQRRNHHRRPPTLYGLSIIIIYWERWCPISWPFFPLLTKRTVRSQLFPRGIIYLDAIAMKIGKVCTLVITNEQVAIISVYATDHIDMHCTMHIEGIRYLNQ